MTSKGEGDEWKWNEIEFFLFEIIASNWLIKMNGEELLDLEHFNTFRSKNTK